MQKVILGCKQAVHLLVLISLIGLEQAFANNLEKLELKRYVVTYVLDAEGYVTSYTTNESPKYTVTITYK